MISAMLSAICHLTSVICHLAPETIILIVFWGHHPMKETEIENGPHSEYGRYRVLCQKPDPAATV